MSWVSENKFMAGFGAVMLVGVGVLSYLTMGARGALDTAKSDYDQKKSALINLYGGVPFPKAENQKKVEAERDKVIAAYNDLQKSLAAMKVPEADISASAFQQELKRAVDAAVAAADKAGVSRTKDGDAGNKREDAIEFKLGFDYLSQLPEGEAAKPLARQLKVIEWVVNMMIEQKVLGLPDIKREPIPEEKRGGKPKPDGDGKKVKGGKAEPEGGVIKRTSFTITFKAHQETAARVLNAIASNKDQFLVIRKLSIVNTAPEPKQKTAVAVVQPAPPPPADSADPPAAAPTPTPTAPVPAAAPAAEEVKDNKKLTFLLGEEMVEVEAEIEILDISPPAEATTKNAKQP